MCIPGLNDDDIDSVEEKMPIPKKKEKRRNTEKRKERSRDAARSRRCKEAEHFTDLAACLPYPEHLVAHLDKASIMRLSITYLKLKSFVDAALPEEKCSLTSASPWSSPLPSAESFEEAVFSSGPLDHSSALLGVLFVVSKDGEITYVSDNVGDQLGLQQVDLLGASMFDYVHPCDHDELRATLTFSGEVAAKPSDKPNIPCEDEEDPDKDEQKIFSLRIKCSTSCNKNRNGTSKPSNHKVFHCTGRLVKKAPRKMAAIEPLELGSDIDDALDYDSDATCDDFKSRHPSSTASLGSKDLKKTSKPHLVFIAESLERVGTSDFLYQKGSFHSKHSLNMKFTDVCDSVTSILGYTKNDLIGKSVFHFHHVLDAVHLEKTFKTLFQKGHCRTNHYRILGKTGGYAWAVTEATVVYGRKSQKPESVSCHNIIISELEHPDEVISAHQLEWSGGGTIDDTDTVLDEGKEEIASPTIPAPMAISDFEGTEPKIEPPDFTLDLKMEPKRKDLPDVDFDVDSSETCFRPKLLGNRLNVEQMLEENFRKEIVGFHPLTKTPCHPVIVQHRRLGSLLVFVSPTEIADALLAFSAVNRKTWDEDAAPWDDVLDPPCFRDENALLEDALAQLGDSSCSPSGCSPLSSGPMRLVASGRTMKDTGSDPCDKSVLCGRIDETPPSLELDLDSCLYSPTPLQSEDETLSPGDQGSSPSLLFWDMKKDGRWSDSISTSDSPLENEVLDLHIRHDDPLMDEAFPLMGEDDAVWCSTDTNSAASLESDHGLSGKKVKNWLLKENPLTSPAEVLDPSPLDDIDVSIDPQPPPTLPPPRATLVPSKGKLTPKSPGKPRTKTPRASTGGKLKNGLKKPFSRNLILGQTYPYSAQDGDWRARAHKAAELRGTAGLYGAQARRLNSTVRIEKPREAVMTRAVPLLVQPEMRATSQTVHQVINGQLTQIMKLVPAKQPVSIVPGAELRLSSPVYLRTMTPKADSQSGKRASEAAECLDMTKSKRPCVSTMPKYLLTTGVQTSSAAGLSVSPSTPSPSSVPVSLLSPKQTNLRCPTALLKSMSVVETGEPHGVPKYHVSNFSNATTRVISLDQLAASVNGLHVVGDGTVAASSTGGVLLLNLLLPQEQPERNTVVNPGMFRTGREGVVDVGRLTRSFSTSLLQPDMQAIPSLLELTTQDCDVNAPLPHTTGLLQGADLLRALDMNNFIAD